MSIEKKTPKLSGEDKVRHELHDVMADLRYWSPDGYALIRDVVEEYLELKFKPALKQESSSCPKCIRSRLYIKDDKVYMKPLWIDRDVPGGYDNLVTMRDYFPELFGYSPYGR